MGDVQFDQNMAMEDMWQVLQVLQQENNNMRQAFEQLQVGARLAPQNLEAAVNQQVSQPAPQKEPRVNLPEKFDGTCSKF